MRIFAPVKPTALLRAALPVTIMKKTTAFSSLLLFGGLGSLSYLATRMAGLNLTFDLRGEDVRHYC